jgi:hypothetical protein
MDTTHDFVGFLRCQLGRLRMSIPHQHCAIQSAPSYPDRTSTRALRVSPPPFLPSSLPPSVMIEADDEAGCSSSRTLLVG